VLKRDVKLQPTEFRGTLLYSTCRQWTVNRLMTVTQQPANVQLPVMNYRSCFYSSTRRQRRLQYSRLQLSPPEASESRYCCCNVCQIPEDTVTFLCLEQHICRLLCDVGLQRFSWLSSSLSSCLFVGKQYKKQQYRTVDRTSIITKHNWNQFLLVVKATANINILSANSTHRRERSHLCHSLACHKCKR